jgi:hypothetical protein
MNVQNWQSKKSLEKIIYFLFLGEKKNFGQFGIVIWNGTPSFESVFIFKMLKHMRIIFKSYPIQLLFYILLFLSPPLFYYP